METNVLDERLRFVRDCESGHWSMTELCERYGVTRPTGYKWLARHRGGGRAGLADRSHAPHQCPHRTSDADGGADRRGAPGVRLGRQEAPAGAPHAVSDAVLAGPQYRQRDPRAPRACSRRIGADVRGRTPGATPLQTERPNQVWPADFKGQFRTGDGCYCYPLTVTDHLSRTLLVCRGFRSVKTVAGAKPVFRALFRAVGLPDAIRSDNGAPFASTGIHGLSALNVWWMQLGIVHQRITPCQSPRKRYSTNGCIAN